MITIVHDSPHVVWMPMEYEQTIYMGGLVSQDNGAAAEGIRQMPQAAGESNTTNKDIPLGVAIGHNLKRPLFSSTYKCEYITSATPLASTTEFVGHGASPYPLGGREHLVKVAVITPDTVLRAPICNAAIGVAPTEGVVSTASGSDGLDCVASASDATTIAQFSTLYIRSGAQKGTYRLLSSGSTTTHTWDTPCYGAVAVGDIVLAINGLRTSGSSRMQIGATCASFIDCAEALTSTTGHYFWINVLRLDLAEKGNEYVEFVFDFDNFCHNRT